MACKVRRWRETQEPRGPLFAGWYFSWLSAVRPSDRCDGNRERLSQDWAKTRAVLKNAFGDKYWELSKWIEGRTTGSVVVVVVVIYIYDKNSSSLMNAWLSRAPGPNGTVGGCVVGLVSTRMRSLTKRFFVSAFDWLAVCECAYGVIHLLHPISFLRSLLSLWFTLPLTTNVELTVSCINLWKHVDVTSEQLRRLSRLELKSFKLSAHPVWTNSKKTKKQLACWDLEFEIWKNLSLCFHEVFLKRIG